jgi:hypothetical protein
VVFHLLQGGRVASLGMDARRIRARGAQASVRFT